MTFEVPFIKRKKKSEAYKQNTFVELFTNDYYVSSLSVTNVS